MTAISTITNEQLEQVLAEVNAEAAAKKAALSISGLMVYSNAAGTLLTIAIETGGKWFDIATLPGDGRLVRWLAADDVRWLRYLHNLTCSMGRIGDMECPEAFIIEFARRIQTADLATIAQAAVAALRTERG